MSPSSPLPLQREVVAAVVGKWKQIVPSLLMQHAAVFEVVDATVVVRRDELLRRAGQRRDVATAVLIGVLRVADQRDVSQLQNAIGAAEGGGGRVDRLSRRGARHTSSRVTLPLPRLDRKADDKESQHYSDHASHISPRSGSAWGPPAAGCSGGAVGGAV
jgi:hypothetical protein